MTKPNGKSNASRTGAYRCAECGTASVQWVGRCPECQAWGTITEVATAGRRVVTAGPVSAPARPIGQLDVPAAVARPTGVAELDRVLGGGLVPGSVVLLAGEPGVGKSTLLLEVAHRAAEGGQRALVVTGEESTAQVRLRAERTGNLSQQLYLAAENDLAALLGHVDDVAPGLLVVDSVQTISTDTVESAVGSVAQIRAVAATVIGVAKARGIATVLVGHVTKEGSVAGPRVLEHLVDVVLHFEGDRHSSLRMVRATKNRFGPADEVGCFEMQERGIVGLPDPSGLFLSDRETAVPGTCVALTLDGRRAMVTEVQALVCSISPTDTPRRSFSSLDSARVAMVLAVLSRHGRLPLHNRDVYAATVGGMVATEPAADLAVALAVSSAETGDALPPTMCAVGEVTLSGDVRRVPALERRLAEAARLGFTHALVPRGRAGEPLPRGPVTAVPVGTLREAIDAIAAIHAASPRARRAMLHSVDGEATSVPPTSLRARNT